jgi:hypothetical protein
MGTGTTRYIVRRVPGSNRCGVWDAATNGWCSPLDLDEGTAVQVADERNARAASPTPAGGAVHYVPSPHARAVRPGRPVPCWILIDDQWWPGTLEVWSQEPGGAWFGAARLRSSRQQRDWYPAAHLRRDRPAKAGQEQTASSR